ncbi:membrane-associated mannitol-induced [Actinidia rufa]|uniref:Membrane-associated mannitol-induced n=1 Tax=Actinidia rufa TaxID=165716 RepID=A0A7J0G9K6_9ERIC|nr:membrane-associated mannitol-induced [Actinidia rufa]
MAIADRQKSIWSLCPFWQPGTPSSSSSSSSSTQILTSQNSGHQNGVVPSSNNRSSKTVSLVAKSFLPARRRLRLDPANNLYFPCASSF